VVLGKADQIPFSGSPSECRRQSNSAQPRKSTPPTKTLHNNSASMTRTKFDTVYFLAPTRNYTPGNRIRLGNIVLDPLAPDEARNSLEPDTLPGYDQHTEEGCGFNRNNETNINASIWANFLRAVLQINVGSDSSSQLDLECEAVVNQEFTPTRAFLDSCVLDPDIQSMAADIAFWQRTLDVYMITGVKIAKGASSVVDFAKSKNIQLHASGDGTAPSGGAVPLKGGMSGGVHSAAMGSDSFTKADDFVLAYRLRRIRLKRSGEIKSDENFTKGSLLGHHGVKVGGVQLEVSEADEGDLAGSEIGETVFEVRAVQDGVRVFAERIPGVNEIS